MMRVQVKQLAKTPYAYAGLFAVALSAFSLLIRLQDSVIPAASYFVWQTVTGTILISVIGFQWVLMGRRWAGQMARKDVVSHRWSGVFATLVFALHATRIGHTWMTIVTVVFFLVAITGILNKEVLKFKNRATYLVWLALHVLLSVALVPLAMVHIWIALVF